MTRCKYSHFSLHSPRTALCCYVRCSTKTKVVVPPPQYTNKKSRLGLLALMVLILHSIFSHDHLRTQKNLIKITYWNHYTIPIWVPPYLALLHFFCHWLFKKQQLVFQNLSLCSWNSKCDTRIPKNHWDTVISTHHLICLTTARAAHNACCKICHGISKRCSLNPSVLPGWRKLVFFYMN